MADLAAFWGPEAGFLLFIKLGQLIIADLDILGDFVQVELEIFDGNLLRVAEFRKMRLIVGGDLRIAEAPCDFREWNFRVFDLSLLVFKPHQRFQFALGDEGAVNDTVLKLFTYQGATYLSCELGGVHALCRQHHFVLVFVKLPVRLEVRKCLYKTTRLGIGDC